MISGKTFYTASRKEWRKWLAENYNKESEIWLVYYKKDSGKPRISYDDAVLEALCFGWIDSIVKKLDEERFMQRFSPRKPKSNLSQMNIERIHELISQDLMTEAGLQAISHVYSSEESFQKKVIIPSYILKSLKANEEAWKNFNKMPASYQRIRIAYIESRKKHGEEMYQKALAHFVKMTAQNKKIGFVRERR